MIEDCKYLFVYGTLRDSSVNHMANFLKENAQYVGEAFIYARLYKITWYPAIVLDSSKSYKVYGEVYKLPLANREAILHELDGYEGIYSNNEDSEEYERVETETTLEDSKILNCFVYNYKASIEQSVWIESGDFIKYLKR